MAYRKHRWFAGGLLALAIATGQLFGSGAAAAAQAPAAARVLYYDASQAAEFVAVVHQGAAVWNARLTAVQLRPVTAGVRANITVLADDGWPRALPASLGNGRFYMGRQAVRDGHEPVRIAAHELGHILGLPDDRTGRCTDLMSGSSAGTSCKNPNPNATEVKKVNDLFSRNAAVPAAVYVG